MCHGKNVMAFKLQSPQLRSAKDLRVASKPVEQRAWWQGCEHYGQYSKNGRVSTSALSQELQHCTFAHA